MTTTDISARREKARALQRIREITDEREADIASAEERLLERNMMMVEARRLGATFTELAQAAGITRSTAHHAVKGLWDEEGEKDD